MKGSKGVGFGSFLVGWLFFFFFLAQSEGSARDAWPHVLGQDRKESR